MRKVLVDLNRNVLDLNAKFKELVFMFYNKQLKKLTEQIISRSSKLVFDFIDAVEHLKFEKAAEIVLAFLDEADAIMDDLSWRLSRKSSDKVTHAIRELLQVIRAQVIFLDQFRQSRFAF